MQTYESINFRRGTQSHSRKCSQIIKKNAYDAVFGLDVSAVPKKKGKKRCGEELINLRHTSYVRRVNSKVDGRAKE